MERTEIDVAVIGAGPAGSRLARRAADGGLRVLLLEKRARVGYPVRCAEAIGPRESVQPYLDLDDSIISSPVDGVVIVAPGGRTLRSHMPAAGFIVDREAFDRRLADLAVEAGAELRTGHQAMRLTVEAGRVTGLTARDLAAGRDYEVRARVTAGADGVEAFSPRWAGLKEPFRPEEVFACAQELVEGIGGVEERMIEFHLGREIAPGGYAWVFPKGDALANVGVGIDPRLAGGLTAAAYLERFMSRRCPDGARTRFVAGGCAVARGLPALAAGGYLVAGEAAHQNNPFSGGGIVNALEGADMAADTILGLGAAEPTAAALSGYTRRWNRSVGRANERFWLAARIFYALDDREVDAVIGRVASFPGVFHRGGVRPALMLAAVVLARPRLFARLVRIARRPSRRAGTG